MRSFDFVIVGAGTAGCVLAARLSEEPNAEVLLLEAGAATGPAFMKDPASWPKLAHTSVDWDDETTWQAGTGAVHPAARGKVLGGSSSINAMTHLRGHRSSYDAWEAAGAEGWNYDELLPFFQRSEHAPGRDPTYRGLHGPMTVTTGQQPDPLWTAVFEAAVEAGHLPVPDLNDANRVGVSWGERNVINGRRQSAADGYLEPALGRPNLSVLTDAHVHNLIVNGHRCRGVRFYRDGQFEDVHARQQVVLAAGAIGSPQLLLLSGIGPSAELRNLGIDVRIDLPGVGANLQDHTRSTISYLSPRDVAPSIDARRPTIRVRSDTSHSDLQIFPVGSVMHSRSVRGGGNGYTIVFSATAPLSRGSVRLASADPEAKLYIDPAYLKNNHDLENMVRGLRLSRQIGESAPLADWRGEEIAPGASTVNDRDCREYIRRSLGSFHHPVGTCRLGPDSEAVVDVDLRVRGIDNLRVADASIIPIIPSANTHATVLAVAERGAELIGKSD